MNTKSDEDRTQTIVINHYLVRIVDVDEIKIKPKQNPSDDVEMMTNHLDFLSTVSMNSVLNEMKYLTNDEDDDPAKNDVRYLSHLS